MADKNKELTRRLGNASMDAFEVNSVGMSTYNFAVEPGLEFREKT
jgi:hypothetical protein